MSEVFLAKPYELRDGEPRLTGTLWSASEAWRTTIDEGVLRIVANERRMRGMAGYFTVLAILAPLLIVGVWWWSPVFPESAAFIVLAAVAISVLFVGVAKFYRWKLRRDMERGPWLVFSAAEGVFEFPRHGLRVSRGDVEGWELVCGWWIRQEDGGAKRFDQLSELQLIFRQEGRRWVLPVLGEPGCGLRKAAEELGGFTGVPLRYVEEEGCWKNPYKKDGKGM